MKTYTTFWYKDTFTKIKVILIWLILLLSLNLFAIIIIKHPDLVLWIFLLILLSWYSSYKSLRNLNKMMYEFSPDWIKIILPSWKKYLLKKEDIISIDLLEKISRWSSLFVKYNYFDNEVKFTTSISNILKIKLEDGRKILISPAIIKDNLILYYSK